MGLQLSDEQRQAIESTPGSPVRVIDPNSGDVYVLVRESVFARIEGLLNDDLADTYPAQIESAMRAGWDDPVMDEYNNYDKHRPA